MRGTRPAEVHPVLFDIFAMSHKIDGVLKVYTFTLIETSRL